MNNLLSPISLQYLAGFMDGEGCFGVYSQKKGTGVCRHASIILSQSGDSGLKLLEQIQTQFGGKIYQHLKIGESGATKDAYKLYWNKEEGIKLLTSLIPHLILKKTSAQEVLTYLSRNSVHD